MIDESTYKSISDTGDVTAITRIPFFQCTQPFRVKVKGLEEVNERTCPRLRDIDPTHISVQTMLIHGENVLNHADVNTRKAEMSASPRWNEWLMGSNELQINNIPREARVVFVVIAHHREDKKMQQTKIAYAVHQLINHFGLMQRGNQTLKLWGYPATKKKSREEVNLFRATNRENLSVKNTATIDLSFDKFSAQIAAPIEEKSQDPNERIVGADETKNMNKQQQEKLRKLKASDVLYELTPEDKEFLWQFRHCLISSPSLLAKFLQSVKWGNREYRFEAHRLLRAWAPLMTMVHYMQLLDYTFADYGVRKFAVHNLKRMKDDELQMYLLQLTQCLKFEPYHDSPLSRFLIERAIRSPYEIGHYFFWHLKAELHEPSNAERFGVILEEYLSHCGRYSKELRKQNTACLKLQRVSAMVTRMKRDEGAGDGEAEVAYQNELARLNREVFEPMGKWHLPIDPKWEVTTLKTEKCRYMSSKMVPLWLCFNKPNPDDTPCLLLFKSGDDLRQDILTLQLLRMMDKYWLAENEDMKLRPYKCIATGVNDQGEGVGMIEVVTKSDTTSGIQLDYGGKMGALRLDPIDLYLKEHNKTDKEYNHSVHNFECSCAGYCVATYVLGIGDRHNGNIMVTNDGHLFHIDFGHFLGNFKKKFGVNRERAAFVFTPEMAYVIGGRKYKKSEVFKRFVGRCAKAFRILRSHVDVFEILFMLMVSAGMPELLVLKDIHYLREKMLLNHDNKKAEKMLEVEILKSVGTMYRRFDNMVHNIKHG